MKTVYFIRHAKSSWDYPHLRDIERPLNDRGRKDAPFMAELIVKRTIKPDKLISSPANRAFTTAAFFAKALGIQEEEIIKNENIYEAYPGALLEIIQQLNDEWNTIFMFGHNPGFTDLVNRFRTKMIPNVPTCGIVKVVSEAERWADFSTGNSRVEETLFPKEVRK